MPIGTVYKAPPVVWRGAPATGELRQPANYQSTILPWPVYLRMQNQYPQRIDETDRGWLHRIKPMFEAQKAALMPLSTQDFRTQLRDAALNRGMRRIVSFDEKKVPGREAQRQLHNSKVISTNPYLQGASDAARAEARFQDEMVQWLADMSDVSTPANGAIFWNGVNENRLAERVAEWNRSYGPGQVQCGQLEATTDVRFVNNKYTWTYGNAYHKYGEKVSEMLGAGSSGHVTAVVRWGLNKWSIFTNTELPRMLYNMEAQILQGAAPKMTDLTIVVIEPLGRTERVHCYVNNNILDAPVWEGKPLPPGVYPAKPDDCIWLNTLGNYVGTSGFCAGGRKVVPASPQFLAYLRSRPTNPSPATPKLLQDIEAIIHANQPMTRG